MDGTAERHLRSNTIVARLSDSYGGQRVVIHPDDDARQIWRTNDELKIQPSDQTEVHGW